METESLKRQSMEGQEDSQDNEESLHSNMNKNKNKNTESSSPKDTSNSSNSQSETSIEKVNPNHSPYQITFDDIDLRHCLELIHINTSKKLVFSTKDISGNLSSTHMAISPTNLNPNKTKPVDQCDLERFVFEYPFKAGPGSVAISPAGRWITGAVTGSKSMVNILKIPLIHHRKSDSKYNLRKLGQNTENESIECSMKATCINRSSNYSPTGTSRGMIQCVWKKGIPHFLFSVDDKEEVYIANMQKVQSDEDKALDYVYLFYSGLDTDTHLAGKMNVSTSFSVCPYNSKTMETEFVLIGNVVNSEPKKENSSSTDHRKNNNKGLSRNIKEVFRRNRSSRPENSFDKSVEADVLLENLPSCSELAAIVLRELLPDNHFKEEGGWGLNFLKKIELSQTSSKSESCARNSGYCSPSMDVIIPAGLHGGTRTRDGGTPFSLVERWRSGGQCDCGGWDIGCPLTVLQPSQDVLTSTTIPGECGSFDLYIEGSEHHTPPYLKMVSVRDGLYFAHFRPNLSAMQCFSIAVAIIHSRSAMLKPKSVRYQVLD